MRNVEVVGGNRSLHNDNEGTVAMTEKDLSKAKNGERSDAKIIYDPLTEKRLNSVVVLGPSLVQGVATVAVWSGSRFMMRNPVH